MVSVGLIGKSFFTGCSLLVHLIPGRARASGLLLCNAADSEPKMLFTGYGAHRPVGTELGPDREWLFQATHTLAQFMIVIRVVKAALVAAIALLASLVAFGNLTDYGTNFAFVQHVMSMDTIYPFSTIRYRAISAPALHHAAYALIITAEAITAVLCWIGAVQLVLQIRADAGVFNRAKTFAIAGLAAGFLLWQVGFMSIGGEWFGMWQSQQWNGVPSAFRFVMIIIAVLIFVALPDQNVERPR